MTLQQMRYVIALAEHGSFNEAAKNLYVSQPTLSNAIRELEEELNTTLFIRTKKGVEISPEGYEFLESARHIVKSSDQLQTRFKGRDTSPLIRFCVSTLHYAFATQAYARLISELPKNYDIILRETSCQQAIEDVVSYKSEIAVIYINSVNSRYVPRQIKDNFLSFIPLYSAKDNIIIRRDHPLCKKPLITIEDLESYPFLTYEYESEHGNTMLDENTYFLNNRPLRMLRTQDRSTLNWLIRNTDGYSVGHGLMDESFHKDTVSVPLDAEAEITTVGWLCREDRPLSSLAKQFVAFLEEEVQFRLPQQD